MIDTLLVFLEVTGEIRHVGTAFFTRRRQSLSTTFTYEPGYLADRRSFAIDPALVLAGGSHHVEGLPGAFQDCTPDRWGRNLIAKRIRANARQGNRTPRTVNDIDYLVGVSDLTRQGALRFKIDWDSPFLSPDHEVPKLVELPRLLHAAERVSRGDDDLAAVKDLLDAGTGSLGGARPKASVRGDGGRLLIAKFPHHHDDWDVTGWEKTALDLAERSAILTPQRQLMRVGNRRALLVERFDRSRDGSRLAYISALTLVSGRDGTGFDYADVAVHLEESSARAEADLEDRQQRSSGERDLPIRGIVRPAAPPALDPGAATSLSVRAKWLTGSVKKSIDFAFDDHPSDDEERPRLYWAVAIIDDCDGCEDLRVELTTEEEGSHGTGLAGHLSPDTARRLRAALASALRDIGEDPGN